MTAISATINEHLANLQALTNEIETDPRPTPPTQRKPIRVNNNLHIF